MECYSVMLKLLTIIKELCLGPISVEQEYVEGFVITILINGTRHILTKE